MYQGMDLENSTDHQPSHRSLYRNLVYTPAEPPPGLQLWVLLNILIGHNI